VLVGVMTQHDRAPCRVRTRSRGPSRERADLSVAQPVVDQGEQSAGRRDDADVAAPGGDDPERRRRAWCPARTCWQASIAAQRTSFEPCLVDRPAVHVGVGLAVGGG
jgi:hypothetical protein